ncbi:MAG TPA: YdcF family protein [Acetobacteraceae bacterium]|nr:YdcF family protein [Acetobacteraceae bacterium]
MSLNVFATALVVPPLAVIPLTVAGAALGWRWRCLGLVLSGISAALLLLLSMPAVSGTLLASLEQGLPLTPPPEDPPQAIVILAGDVVHAVGPSGFGIGPLTLERVAAGAVLYDRVHLPILVTGGRPDTGGGPSIASRMTAALEQDFAVPVRWQDGQSANTWQNAAFSAAILSHHGIGSIYLVTHAWHMRRALFCFRHFGIIATAVPVRIDRMPTPVLADFAPTVTAWVDAYYAFHEWIGLVWYHLRY